MAWRSRVSFATAGLFGIVLLGTGVYYGLSSSRATGDASETPADAQQLATTVTISQQTPAGSSSISYANAGLGIALVHPSDWYPHDVQTPSGETTILFSAPVDNPNPQDAIAGQALSFTIAREEHRDESIENWAVRILTEPYGLGAAEREYVTIGEHLGLQLRFTDEPVSLTAVNVGRFRYVVRGRAVTGTYADHNDRIQQVIRTMTFAP